MFNRNPLFLLFSAALAGRFNARDRAKPGTGKYRPMVIRRRHSPIRGYDITTVQATPTSRYRPHQSSRECLRRIGGAMWEQFKRDDRVRRGLPADKTTGA